MDLSRINEKQECVAYGCICLEFRLTWFSGGHNRAACFLHEADYLIYLDELAVAARRYEVEIHAYPLGSDSFRTGIEARLSRCVRFAGLGRPLRIRGPQ